MTSTNPHITASLAIIQLNILFQELINMTRPFYDKISNYSKSISATNSNTKQFKMHPKFHFNQRQLLRCQFRSHKSIKTKTKTKNIKIVCRRGTGMFVKQYHQFRFRYCCLNAKNITE